MLLKNLMQSIALSNTGKFCAAHSPQILLGIGCVSGFGAIGSTVLATKRSIDIIDAQKKANTVVTTNPDGTMVSVAPSFTFQDMAQLTWKEWLLPAGFASVSIASFVGAYKIEHARGLTLAALLSASEGKLLSLEKAIASQLEEKKAEEIKTEAVSQQVKEYKDIPKDDSGDPYPRKEGEYKTIDPFTNQVWWDNYSNLERAIAVVDKGLMAYDQTFNDFVRAVKRPGFKTTSIGENLVWRADSCRSSCGIRIRTGMTDECEPAYFLDYTIEPKWFRSN